MASNCLDRKWVSLTQGPNRSIDRRAIIGLSKPPTHEGRKSRDSHQEETLIPFLVVSRVNQRVPIIGVDIQIRDQESSNTEAHVLLKKHVVNPIIEHRKVPTFAWGEAPGYGGTVRRHILRISRSQEVRGDAPYLGWRALEPTSNE